ncbi:hypothetical protein [Streptococcus thermophilus]|uniref:hypothetical protein n=1 Tax=Streptococcus thermophilus TaxID=1308 RepID=UPI0022FD49FE|nr:hypothetical protein [Streptococcus thermophilus]MDA5412999.1 hypothetical protein [Streptococcus thermophilus]
MLSKWKNLKRWQKWAIVLVCLAVLGKVFEITGIAPETKTEPVKTVQTSSSKPKAKAKAKTKTSSSSDLSNPQREEKASKESSSSEEKESKSETKESSSSDGPKDVTADQMASFIEYFQNDLTEKGVDISQYGFYIRDTILYMSVPVDYKYYDKTDLQKFADGMLAKEHEAFNVWAAINKVNYERYPMFHNKADDGSAIASQKLNGEMKVKVK